MVTHPYLEYTERKLTNYRNHMYQFEVTADCKLVRFSECILYTQTKAKTKL